MENELEVVNIRLVREPSLYSEQILDSPQAVVELMAKELSQYDIRQVKATQSWQVYMDEHYDDAKMARIYPNAKTK